MDTREGQEGAGRFWKLLEAGWDTIPLLSLVSLVSHKWARV